MPRIALATAVAAFALDDDLPPLVAALAADGAQVQVVAWDDPTVAWSRFDAVLLRSTWDYSQRLPEFLRWCERIDRETTLLNPLPVLRWNTDKHYLAGLERAGVAIVPSTFVEPDANAADALAAFLAAHADAAEFVVKPAIGAGSRDAQRYSRTQEVAPASHIARLLDADRSVLLQPYLPAVDEHGETALIYLDGKFSHAIRKGPLLRANEDATRALFAAEHITVRKAGADERALADAVLAAIPRIDGVAMPLLYARVDLIRGTDGAPRLLELELAEPSLFFNTHPAAAERLSAALLRRLRG
jgi:O-ureido-D-serine cyclo-ligase